MWILFIVITLKRWIQAEFSELLYNKMYKIYRCNENCFCCKDHIKELQLDITENNGYCKYYFYYFIQINACNVMGDLCGSFIKSILQELI